MPTLDWIGKSAVVKHHLQVPYRLIHCERGESVGASGYGNLLVEGDNLDALKALLPYYAGKVKCIYIDPPYNTGNEDWIYNDNVNAPEMKRWLGEVVGRDDLSRHDKWLCMMYPRLVLLRELLRENGAIFVSIDDNEVANLRAIMDDIFKARNFVATIIWQKMFSPKNTARHLSESHDYILLYAKNAETWRPNLIVRTSAQDKRYKNPDNDARGNWQSSDLSARNFYSLGTYPITTPSGRVIKRPPKGRYWTVSKESFEELVKDNRIWWGKHGKNMPRVKRFLSEVKEGIVPQTIWTHDEVGNTQEAKKEIVQYLSDEGEVFITPKPTRLIKRILHLATDKDSLVMDSFAGSGTTGHAVLQLNKEDGGNRKFILVEMQPNIARDITAERLRRVINGYGETEGLGGGFRYCTLGESLFDEREQIRDAVKFNDLAHHIFFTETGEPLPKRANGRTPFIGQANGTAYYLLWDKENGGQALDGKTLRALLNDEKHAHEGLKVVYADGCRLSNARLASAGVMFKQIPYQIRVS